MSINIAGCIDELLVFEDPKYCKGELNKDGKCEQLKELKYLSVCRLFKNEAGRKTGLIYDQEKGIQIKCDACKAAYEQAKLNQYAERYYQEAEFGRSNSQKQE